MGDFFKKPDTGMLVLRVAAGLTMFLHGLAKYVAGADYMTAVGKAMSMYGINFAPLMWGIAASTVETVGGLLILLGFCFRPAAGLMAFVLLTALLSMSPQLSLGGFQSYAHAWTMLLMCVGFLFTGPGNYAVRKG